MAGSLSQASTTPLRFTRLHYECQAPRLSCPLLNRGGRGSAVETEAVAPPMAVQLLMLT